MVDAIVTKVSAHLNRHLLKRGPTSTALFKRNSLESRFKNKLRFLNLKNAGVGAVEITVFDRGADITGFNRELTVALPLNPERTQKVRPNNDKFVSCRKSPEPLGWLKSENNQSPATSRKRAVHLVCAVNRGAAFAKK